LTNKTHGTLQFAHTLISTSGKEVGLPGEQMGNSEVGHLNLGAGRITTVLCLWVGLLVLGCWDIGFLFLFIRDLEFLFNKEQEV
jgi:hypothetical protein